MFLRRQELEAQTRRVLNRGRFANPDVLLVDTARGFVVVKDFAPRCWWIRALWGRFSLARELRAYRALGGHPNIPRLLGRIDPYAFAVEYRPGRVLSRRVRRRLPTQFWDRLEVAIDAMHERGVVHLDLRHRSNILVDAQAHPILIDFGSAQCFRVGSVASRWLLPPLAQIDRSAIAKWRQRFSTGTGAGSSARRSASRPT